MSMTIAPRRSLPSWVRELLVREGVDLSRVVEVEWAEGGDGLSSPHHRSATARLLLDREDLRAGTKTITVSEARPPASIT